MKTNEKSVKTNYCPVGDLEILVHLSQVEIETNYGNMLPYYTLEVKATELYLLNEKFG